MEKPSWKNTLNYENGIWSFLSDFIAAAACVGYPYAAWHDNKVYTYTRDKHGNLVTESTGFTLEDLDA
ncbi:MAG TPA: hypothetical protein PLP33_27705 [Leptospiraceae bacterium]|nr:hypothetical protein [Leptospiraceae bacterium]